VGYAGHFGRTLQMGIIMMSVVLAGQVLHHSCDAHHSCGVLSVLCWWWCGLGRLCGWLCGAVLLCILPLPAVQAAAHWLLTGLV
jgi:hypothetical protein